MRIGEVANQTKVSVQAVRLYERIGLLNKPMRSSSGYRDYPAETVTLVQFIKRAQSQGFTLAEIKSLIHLREQRPASARAMRSVAEAKLTSLNLEIKRLQQQADAIKHGLNRCRCAEPFPLCMFTNIREGELK
jgi:MerR family transcriptional regulator, mercuric resistance operon regulatory protein